jgi:hypothetical protein
LSGCGGGEEPGSRPVATTTTSTTTSVSTSTQSPAPSTSAAAPASEQVTTSASSHSGAGQSGIRADAICLKRNRELKGAPITGGSLSVLASNASRRAAIERSALAELSALPPPAGATKPWKTMIEQTSAVLVEVTKLANAAHAGDSTAATRAVVAAAKPQLVLLAAAVNAGAKHCIQVG